jgi:hypothetical protein
MASATSRIPPKGTSGSTGGATPPSTIKNLAVDYSKVGIDKMQSGGIGVDWGSYLGGSKPGTIKPAFDLWGLVGKDPVTGIFNPTAYDRDMRSMDKERRKVAEKVWDEKKVDEALVKYLKTLGWTEIAMGTRAPWKQPKVPANEEYQLTLGLSRLDVDATVAKVMAQGTDAAVDLLSVTHQGLGGIQLSRFHQGTGYAPRYQDWVRDGNVGLGLSTAKRKALVESLLKDVLRYIRTELESDFGLSRIYMEAVQGTLWGTAGEIQQRIDAAVADARTLALELLDVGLVGKANKEATAGARSEVESLSVTSGYRPGFGGVTRLPTDVRERPMYYGPDALHGVLGSESYLPSRKLTGPSGTRPPSGGLVVLGPMLGAARELVLLFVVAHEMAHLFDGSGRAGVDTTKSPLHQKVQKYFQSLGAKEEQRDEIFADWFATQVLARRLEQMKLAPEVARAQVVEAFRFWLTSRAMASAEEAEGDPHPTAAFRVGQILGGNPDIVALLNPSAMPPPGYPMP